MSRLVLSLVLLLIVAQTASADGFEPIDQPSAEYAELDALAGRWRMAVSRQEADEVVKYALPEAQEVVRGALSDQMSTLYRELYGTRVQDLFQKPGLRTLLIPHKDLTHHGMGTTVCFLDPKQPEPSWPISREALSALTREVGAFCVFAFRADDRWYVSYAFAFPEGDG